MEEIVTEPSAEQNPEEGEVPEEGEITPVTDPVEDPAPETTEEPSEETVTEPTEEEVVEEPAVDPEADPEEADPAIEEEEAADDVTVDADEESFTVSISGFDAVSAYITANAEVGGTRSKTFAKTGSVKAAKGAAVTVEITAKPGAKIKSVKNGENDATVTNGSCTISIASLTADATITVDAVAAYKLSTDFGESGVSNIALDASLKDAIGATTDAGLTVSSADVAQGADLKFTIPTAAGTDARYIVSYKANGSDSAEPITAVPETVGTGDDARTVDTYTVKKEDLADFHAIEICVEKEEKVDLTVALTAIDNVDVIYWGAKKAGAAADLAAEAWIEGDNAASYEKITKAYVGDVIKFKLAVKDEDKASKEIKTVTATVDDKEEEVRATDGSYAFTVKKGETTFTVTTDYKAEAVNTLTYTLDSASDEGSVTSAVISKIQKGTTPSDVSDVTSVLTGGETAALKSGKAVSVLKADGEDEIVTIEVTVTPKAGYEIVKTDADKHIKIADGVATYKFTKPAGADSAEITANMAVAVKTQAKAVTEDGTFFDVKLKGGITHLSALAVTGANVQEVMDDTQDPATHKGWKVTSGATATFTVTAEAGYQPKGLADNAKVKSVVAGTPAADGKVVYTVTLLASQLGAADADIATNTFEIDEEGITFSAEVKAAEGSEGNYKPVTIKYFTGDDLDVENTYSDSDIPYGAKLTATIEKNTGCHLVSVSYNMDGKDTPVSLNDEGNAEVVIDKVTGDVTINVTAAKDYEKTTLADADDTELSLDENGVYDVKYNEAYLVGLTNGGTPVKVSEYKAVVKNESGEEVSVPRITSGDKYKIDLSRAKSDIAGQVITIDLVVGEQIVDTYILNVNKKTSKLTIEGVTAAAKNQRVASVENYAIETDGEVEIDSVTDSETILDSYEIVGNKLVVATSAMTTAQITKTAATETAPAVYHSATITLVSKDDPDLEASIVVTAQPLIEDMANKEITLEAGDQADTVLNMTLGLDGVAAPLSGELYYEVTVTPKTVDGKAITTEPKLLSTVTVPAIAKKGDRQNKQVQVAVNPNLGMGAAWEYTVTAKLTYDVDGGTTTESTKVMTKDFATVDGKEIKYENNLKLTKDKNFKGTLYTGQSGEIVIASPKWSTKNVTYKILSGDIYDSDKYDAYGNSQPKLSVGQNAAGQIVVTNVPEDTYLGKHTITVEATADQTTAHEMYKSRATITVTVAKGIEDIDIAPASYSIYKKDAKTKATMKMTAYLNSDYYSDSSWDGKKYVTAPKSKNLTWELVGADSYEGYDVAVPDSFANKAVTINAKNGTITVDKKFEISKNKANNRFAVKATAADYKGNEVVGYSGTIEITSDALGIAKVAFVQHDYVADKYNVVAVQNADKEEVKIDATVINGATVYALPASANLAVGEYTKSQFDKVATINKNNYTVASSGKKVVEVNSSNYLRVLTAGKKVNITVTANDGSKQKRTVPLNLGWTGATKDMALQITSYGGASGDVFNPASDYSKQADKTKIAAKDITITGAARLSIYLMEGNKDDGSSGTFERADGFTNYKLAAKGGKLTTNSSGYAELVTTAKVTTLTLTVGTGRDAKKSTYTITNKAYELTEKAPKVAVKGSLREMGHKSEQQVTLTVKNGKDLYGAKNAKVEIDWSSLTAKNRSALYKLNRTLTESTVALNKDTGEMTLSFADPDGGDWIRFTPGSYKLKLTVGTGTGSSFTPETLPANVTLKVAKNKAFTFKPQTSYTIGKLDGGAILTGKSNVAKGEKTFMNFYGLQNANVSGRPNNFTHYFTIAYDGINNTQRLVLNTGDALFKETFGITAESPLNWDTIDLTKIDKKDLTGYVSWDARANQKYYGIGTTGWENSAAGTTKITVKLAANPKNDGAWKASLKYTTNKAEVLAKDNEKAVINVMSGNEYVTVGAAVIYVTDQLTAVSINNKGQIEITVKGVEAKKTYKTTMKVVPFSSVFFDTVNALNTKEKEAEYKAAIEKYGIPVSVSVTAKATAAEVAATPDPVTASAAVNLINDHNNQTKTNWTNASIAKTGNTVNGSPNIAAAEQARVLTNLASEVTTYLNTYAAYKDGFTVAGNNLSWDSSEQKLYAVLTVTKGSDIEYVYIELTVTTGSGSGSGGGDVDPPPTVTANSLATAIAALENITITQAQMTGSGATATVENSVAEAAIKTAITNNGNIELGDYTFAVTGVTVTLQPDADNSTDGTATVSFSVSKTGETAIESITITITATTTP